MISFFNSFKKESHIFIKYLDSFSENFDLIMESSIKILKEENNLADN